MQTRLAVDRLSFHGCIMHHCQKVTGEGEPDERVHCLWPRCPCATMAVTCLQLSLLILHLSKYSIISPIVSAADIITDWLFIIYCCNWITHCSNGIYSQMHIKMQHKVELFRCVLPCPLARTAGQPVPQESRDEKDWEIKDRWVHDQTQQKPSFSKGIIFWNGFPFAVNKTASPKTCKEKVAIERLTFPHAVEGMWGNIWELGLGSKMHSALVLLNNHKFGDQ